MFIQSFLFIYLDYALDSKFCLSWVHFWKRVGNFELCKKNFNFLIGLYPIWFFCICVGPLWHFNMYLGKIHSCSCIAYMLVLLVHTKCLIKWPNGILVLFWTPMSTKLWGLPWLYMFWSLVVCSNVLHMHHICTPHAHLMHTFVHLSCFAFTHAS